MSSFHGSHVFEVGANTASSLLELPLQIQRRHTHKHLHASFSTDCGGLQWYNLRYMMMLMMSTTRMMVNLMKPEDSVTKSNKLLGYTKARFEQCCLCFGACTTSGNMQPLPRRVDSFSARCSWQNDKTTPKICSRKLRISSIVSAEIALCFGNLSQERDGLREASLAPNWA